jgi:SPP1 gp7 family putative phage head morphogenesis protein
MKSRINTYWNKRANERMASYHKDSDEIIRKITTAYDKAIKDINEDINSIFYKYMKDSELSEKEIRQLLNSKIPKKELDAIRAKIYGIQDEELKRYMMAQLNTEAYKARITRLEALKESIYINTKLAADAEIKQSTKLYTDNINKAYYTNLFDIQKGLGIGFNVAEMPLETIQEILKNKWSGEHYSKRIWRNTDVLAEKLEEVITSGLMTGKSSRKMATELEELTNYGKFAAERIIRTETTYISNASEIESYKECGIDKYVFIATLDLRTSKVCREHDKKIYNVKDAEVGVNLPPLHPYCRSTTRAYFDNMESLKRRARDPEIGKNYIVPGDMNYQEWYDKFVVDKYGKDKAEVFEKMIKNKASDRKQFNKFKEYLGKDSPNTLKDFQELKYNNINEWSLVKDYAKSRENNMISAFTPYSQYKEYKEIINSDIVGLTTSNGIKITGQSKHFIERVFGTNADPKTNRPRSGVGINDIKDALLNGSVRIRKSDPNSIKFITDKCMVSINPNTGVLIQTNL